MPAKANTPMGTPAPMPALEPVLRVEWVVGVDVGGLEDTVGGGVIVGPRFVVLMDDASEIRDVAAAVAAVVGKKTG